ncbi:MAG: DNA methyltransferase [Clostridia bacterium]|nr:DNA methyltransferase [Clostridia bacterium]
MKVDIFTTDKKYNIIYADPPWKYGGGKNKNFQGLAVDHYPTMKTEEICKLPIQRIADDAVLFMWTTYPQLEACFKVAKAWGFKYRTAAFTWVKLNKDQSPFFGLGFWTRSNAEVCLIFTKGNYPRRVNNKVSSVIQIQREKHSKKPDVARQRIVELMGNIPRIELFAREREDGWDCWGNEL